MSSGDDLSFPFDDAENRSAQKFHLLRNSEESMKTLCAWCGALIKEGVLSPEGQESHGICRECLAKLSIKHTEVSSLLESESTILSGRTGTVKKPSDSN